ncbi:MAG: hypothetical protein HKN45_00020, partial [Flavobacteriales bacterium]|nr:hypothetical protein [Flavobacteriales bacterium]
QGTPVPNGTVYESFGASGTIVGDTIFYYGGAVGFSFNSTGRLRKGVIDPEDPTQITWSELGMSPGAKGYRAAPLTADGRAFWIGGSAVTYNYNGIAYNGSGGVEPLNRILGYDPAGVGWTDQIDQPFGIMDLRGSAQVAENQFVICGGMEADQTVTDRAFLLTFGGISDLAESEELSFDIYPNPVSIGGSLTILSVRPYAFEYFVLGVHSKVIAEGWIQPGENLINISEMNIHSKGIYLWRPKESGEFLRLIVR